MAKKLEDDENFKELADLKKATNQLVDIANDPEYTQEEVAQHLVDVLNAYGDELRFLQEQYHYCTGKWLGGFAYPKRRIKMSDIILRKEEND